MNAGETRDLVRELTGVRLTNTLSDADGLELINRAYHTICNAAEWSFLEATDTLPVIEGTITDSQITLANVRRVLSISINNGRLLEQRDQAYYNRLPAHRRLQREPYGWFRIEGDTIQVFPKADATYSLKVRGIAEPSAITLDADLFEWDDRTHDPVVAYEASAQLLEREGDSIERIVWMRNQAQTFINNMARAYLPAGKAIEWPPNADLGTARGMPLSFNEPATGGGQ